MVVWRAKYCRNIGVLRASETYLWGFWDSDTDRSLSTGKMRENKAGIYLQKHFVFFMKDRERNFFFKNH